MGILYPFFVDPTFMNLAKMQIPFSRVIRIYIPILLKFVSQQSGLHFSVRMTLVVRTFLDAKKAGQLRQVLLKIPECKRG